jgi:hypothetical protein
MWRLTAIRILLVQISITIQFSVPEKILENLARRSACAGPLFPRQPVLSFLQPFVFAAQTFYLAVQSIKAQRQAMAYLFQ